MDKALGFEPRDCGFESRRDLSNIFGYFSNLYILSKYIQKIWNISFYSYKGHIFHIYSYQAKYRQNEIETTMCAIWCTIRVVYAGTVGYRGYGGGAAAVAARQ